MKFELTDEEQKSIDSFIFSHACSSKYAGAIGGTYTYKFTPTSLGIVSKIVCNFCHQEFDFSDYKTW